MQIYFRVSQGCGLRDFLLNKGEIGVCVYIDGGDTEEIEYNCRGEVFEKAIADGIQQKSGFQNMSNLFVVIKGKVNFIDIYIQVDRFDGRKDKEVIESDEGLEVVDGLRRDEKYEGDIQRKGKES